MPNFIQNHSNLTAKTLEQSMAGNSHITATALINLTK